MTAFERKIYDVVAGIPVGRVLTYGQVALLADAPGCARQVGHAMAHAPGELGLPCHRVVNAAGDMAPPEVFGAGMQKARLQAEGIPFRENGRIDWKRYRMGMDSFSADHGQDPTQSV